MLLRKKNKMSEEKVGDFERMSNRLGGQGSAVKQGHDSRLCGTGIDQGLMKGLMSCSLLVVRLDQEDCHQLMRKVLKWR